MQGVDISKLKSQKKKESKSYKKAYLDLFSREITFGSKQLVDKKKEAFYNELSALIRSGIDIKTALELAATSFTKERHAVLFKNIIKDVIGGKSLSQTLENLDRFSSYEFYCIRIGEETGKLGEVLTELAGYYKSKISQRRKIIGAITYPALVLGTSFGAIFFMLKFVVPMFADVFQRFGGKLPYLTAAIVSCSNWLDNNLYFLLLFLLIIFAFYFSCRNELWFKKYASRVLLKIPLIGDLVTKIYLARFANTMRLLTGTNTPLLVALKMVRNMINFYPILVSLELAEKEILMGNSLSAALEKDDFYPVKFIQLIKIAEEVNRLEYFFEQLSSQYTDEVEYKTNAISGLLEPLIIIFLGLAVGVILIAMYLPMFQMSNTI